LIASTLRGSMSDGDHLLACLCERDDERQTHVSETNDANTHDGHSIDSNAAN